MLKTFFSIISVVFLVWVGIVYILPQTDTARRIHFGIENRLSKQLGGEVKIENITFGLFYVKAENLRLNKEGRDVLTIPYAKALLNLSALFSRRIHWFEIVVNKPQLNLVGVAAWEKRDGLLASGRFLAPLLGFHLVQVRAGAVRYNLETWENINGSIAAGKSKPIEAELSFWFRQKKYKSQVSLAALDSNKPLAMALKVREEGEGRYLSLNGFWQDLTFTNFYGAGEGQNRNYYFKTNHIKINSNNSTFIFDDTDIKLTNWHFTAEGSGDIFGDVYFNIKDGTGNYQKLTLANITGQGVVGSGKVEINNIKANVQTSKKIIGKIAGRVKVEKNKTQAELDFTHPKLEAFLRARGFGFNMPLGAARLKTSLEIEGETLTTLQAQGKIGKSAVSFNLKGDVIISTWQADNSRELIKQLSLPRFLYSAGDGRVVWKLKRGKDKSALFGLRAQFGAARYFAQGKLGEFTKPLYFDGKVKFHNSWSKGIGKIIVEGGALSAGLNMDSLRLDKLPARDAFDNLQATFNIFVKNMTYGKHNFKRVESQLYADGKHWRIKNIEGQFAKGAFTAAADVSFKNKVPHYALALKLSDVDSALLMNSVLNKSVMEGKFDLTTRLSAYGTSQKEILQTLIGRGEMVMRDGKIIGFDASLLNQSLPQLELFSFLGIVINYAFNNGATTFDKGRGRFHIHQGQLKTEPVRFKSKNLDARLDFNADLIKQEIGARFQFKLPLKPDYPALGWRLKFSRKGAGWVSAHQGFQSKALEKAIASDIINGGINEIKTKANIYRLPLELQDLLRAARKKNNLSLELELDLAS